MNILFINSIGKNKFGGGEKWMVHAAKGLRDKGNTVIVAGRKDSRILDYAAKKELPTAIIEIHADISPLKTFQIASYLRKHSIDVLICNLNKDVRVAGLGARLAGTPAVLARHGMLLCSKKWKHKISLTKLTDGIITNSNTIKETYGSYGWFHPDFVKVIYNGIEIPEHVQATDFDRRFPGKNIIYSAGRLSEQKGFSYLIEAAAILKKKRDDLVFVISGEGKLLKTLQKQAHDAGLQGHVVFEGFTPDIYPSLKACDLFVLASLFEGMPNVVMEAMAMGKPVIATDVNGVRELIKDGETGIVIPPRNPMLIAEAIEQLLCSPEKMNRFGRDGKERVCNFFTMELMINNLENHLLEKVKDKSMTR